MRFPVGRIQRRVRGETQRAAEKERKEKEERVISERVISDSLTY